MKKIMLQLDSDPKVSVFDQIVAYDAGVDHIISMNNVLPEEVENLVHGTIFTRGGDALKNTAIFIGGSNAAEGEKLLRAVVKTFFGPFRVSVVLDSNGSNTTAVAAVRKITQTIEVKNKQAFVLGGTGPVGLRAAVLLAKAGCQVGITSRNFSRAEATCQKIKVDFGLEVLPFQASSQEELGKILQEAEIVLATGGAGVNLLSKAVWTGLPKLQVLADINAVPPLGIEGIELSDNGMNREAKLVYGAIAIGNLKMKIHKQCIQELFQQNNRILDIAEIYQLEI